MTAAAKSSIAKPAKLGAEKLTPEEQRRRFEELAREAGCDEGSEERFEAAVMAIGRKQMSHIKQGKTAEELDALVHREIEQDGRSLNGPQWIKIVSVEPSEIGGPNWRIAHSGEAGGLSDALDAVQNILQKHYDLI